MYLDVVLTKDMQYILINANSKKSSEVHTLDATDPNASPELLRKRDPNVLYFVDHATDAFYVVTNDSHVYSQSYPPSMDLAVHDHVSFDTILKISTPLF